MRRRAWREARDGRPEGEAQLSTLTKICVVLLVLLTLFASVVFIRKAGVDTNWRAYAEKQRHRANIQESYARAQMVVAQHWQRLYEEAERQAKSRLEQLSTTLVDKDGQIARLNRMQLETQGKLDEALALNKALQSTLDSQIQHNKDLIAQLDKQRKDNIQLADQLRRAQDQIKEYLIDIDSLKKQAEYLREQLTAKEGEVTDLQNKVRQLESEVARLRAGAGAAVAAGPAEAVTPAGEKITGEVLAVKGDLASLNVGSASGVKKGMVFTLYRDDKFVAHLRIAEVGPSTCAGVLYDRIDAVKAGDKATNRLDLE